MTHGTEHHLEHAEHVKHHAHDPFDRQVAMTMAIVAAVLACASMLSHRAHNETLRLLNEASLLKAEINQSETEVDTLHTQSGIRHTQASDQWNYFQAKKNRSYLYEALADLIPVVAKEPDVKLTAESGNGGPNEKGPKNAAKLAQDWKKKAGQYKKDADDIEKKALALEKEAEELREQAHQKDEKTREHQEEVKQKEEESHHVHTRADWLDYGHLGIELALVLCSIAVLTKQRGFWFSGIGVGILGAIVAGSSFMH
jgi:hypothetical protein